MEKDLKTLVGAIEKQSLTKMYYIATIQVAIVADNADHAGEILDEQIKKADRLLDWQYIPPLYLKPAYAGEIRVGDNITPGDAFGRLIEPIE